MVCLEPVSSPPSVAMWLAVDDSGGSCRMMIDGEWADGTGEWA